MAKLDEAKIFEMLGKLDERTIQILEQAKKTNGTVIDHERRLKEIESKNDTAAGAKAVKKSMFERSYQVGEKVALLIFGLWIGKVWK